MPELNRKFLVFRSQTHDSRREDKSLLPLTRCFSVEATTWALETQLYRGHK